MESSLAKQKKGLSNSEVVEKLKQGLRLTKPEKCSEDIWALVVTCWHEKGSPSNQGT